MMKKSLSLLCFLTVISVMAYAQATLNVHLVYNNSGLTPIKNTQVLLKLNGTTVATGVTDTTGHYTFTNLTAGTYQCIPICTILWGGCNSTDCMLIMTNFINTTGGFLTGLNLLAAEINGMGPMGLKPNSLDALLLCKRIAGLIPNFMPPVALPGQPDWKYETLDILVPASGTVTQQIKMICTGDVNGSYVP